jgi:hypothetical protein
VKKAVLQTGQLRCADQLLNTDTLVILPGMLLVVIRQKPGDGNVQFPSHTCSVPHLLGQLPYVAAAGFCRTLSSAVFNASGSFWHFIFVMEEKAFTGQGQTETNLD